MRVESTFVFWTCFCGYCYAVFYCCTCKYFNSKYNGYVDILGRLIKYAHRSSIIVCVRYKHQTLYSDPRLEAHKYTQFVSACPHVILLQLEMSDLI
jgi:hypothetical protein